MVYLLKSLFILTYKLLLFHLMNLIDNYKSTPQRRKHLSDADSYCESELVRPGIFSRSTNKRKRFNFKKVRGVAPDLKLTLKLANTRKTEEVFFFILVP